MYVHTTIHIVMMIPFSFKRISDFKSRQLQLIFLKYIEHGPPPNLVILLMKNFQNLYDEILL